MAIFAVAMKHRNARTALEEALPRLLLVTQHFWPESFKVSDLAEGLVELGIEVDVLCGLPNYPLGEWFDGYSENGPFDEVHNGVRLYRSREIPRTGNTSKTIFLNYVSWPLYAARAIKRLPGQYDAVLCYNTSPVLMMWPAIRAARRFKIPLVEYVLDLWPENLFSVLEISNALLRKLALRVSDWHYKNAERIIVLSDGMREKLVQRIGFDCPSRCTQSRRDFVVIPQYCEEFYDAGEAAANKRDDSSFTLAFAGNLSPAQDLEGILDSFAAARSALRENGTSLRFLIYGNGMSRDSIKDKIQSLELQDSVEMHDPVPPEEIPEIFQQVDALLVSLSNSPSLGLTIPAKLSSCMASRKPLLVSITGAGAEAARQSGGALVCDAGDRQQMTENIVELATMPRERLAALGEKSYDYYVAHYKRSVIIKKIADCCLK